MSASSTVIVDDSSAKIGGVQVTHARHLIAADNKIATDSSDYHFDPAKPHCTHCRKEIPDSFKLDVIDPFDPVFPASKETIIKLTCEPVEAFGATNDVGVKMPVPLSETKSSYPKDYVRMPFTFDRQQFPNKWGLGPFVFCHGQCLRLYMLQRVGCVMRSQINDLIAEMMLHRHGVSEPCLPAPPAECMNWMWAWNDYKPTEGLSRQQFQYLCSQTNLIARLAGRVEYVAPDWEEAQAITDKNPRFLPNLYNDNLEPIVLQELQASDGTPAVNREANPDSDAETDYATLTILKPT